MFKQSGECINIDWMRSLLMKWRRKSSHKCLSIDIALLANILTSIMAELIIGTGNGGVVLTTLKTV